MHSTCPELTAERERSRSGLRVVRHHETLQIPERNLYVGIVCHGLRPLHRPRGSTPLAKGLAEDPEHVHSGALPPAGEGEVLFLEQLEARLVPDR